MGPNRRAQERERAAARVSRNRYIFERTINELKDEIKAAASLANPATCRT